MTGDIKTIALKFASWLNYLYDVNGLMVESFKVYVSRRRYIIKGAVSSGTTFGEYERSHMNHFCISDAKVHYTPKTMRGIPATEIVLYEMKTS